MKKCVFVFLIMILVVYGYAQTVTSTKTLTDSLRVQFEKDAKQITSDFEAYSKQAREEYAKYEAQAKADYFRYVRSIKKVWGEDSVIDNTRTEWVEYSDDYHSRSIVDFDKGEIFVEITLDDIGVTDSTEINARLAEAIERMLNSRGSTCPYQSSVDASEALTQKPILDGLVDFSKYKFDTSSASTDRKLTSARPVPPVPTVKGKNLTVDRKQDSLTRTVGTGKTMAQRALEKDDKRNGNPLASKQEEARERAEQKKQEWSGKGETASIAKAIAAQSKKTVKVTGMNKEARQVVQVQMSLVADNLSKNAALYKDLVAEFSRVYQIEASLIYAVMEQESCFNPEATSWVPAYGLMQLVPTSGGFDAFRYVYKREWIPTRSYLFNPRNNIELGTAYLRVLSNQFASVANSDCRKLCVIAGYNTGAGNVSRAFTGATNLNKAIPLINECNYEQLYSHLTTRLSTSEARNYVSGVTKRQKKYLK
ncbi:murein transglycosylase domain-containing protein [Butyricimonas sp. Marseille-P3923]|uniref:murein transglycosylase domain-containing protein n=1 Tax=Butyricimonas sp. Marseille-P3923 TaxID=1987504 RepID=UPI000C06A5FB|nr:murein transglycosylase domain-containing protein [Butyricimonas sp. Marseille-P3923]